MVTGNFSVAQRYQCLGIPYRVVRDLGKGQITVEDLTTGRYLERSVGELLAAWKRGDLILGEGIKPDDTKLAEALAAAHMEAFRQSYSEDQQAEAMTRLVYVQQLSPLPRTGALMTPVIHEVWAKKLLWVKAKPLKRPPHFTTVALWIRKYRDAGNDIRALIDRHDAQGNTAERLDPAVIQLVDDLITTRYLTLERPTIKSLHKLAKGRIGQMNATRVASQALKAPSYGSLKRRIRQLPAYDVCRARYGHRIAELKFRVAGRGVPTECPLSRTSMDHSRMDLFVVDEKTRLPLGRPWLTIVLDEHTRYVLGYYIGFEQPSNVSMSRALKQAIAPKDKEPRVMNAWDAWGVVEVVMVDQAFEFHAKPLEHAAGRLGMSIQFCPRCKPWFKGKVERFFGTLNQGLLADLKGKTFSNIFEKGDYDPAEHAVVTLQTLRQVVHLWILDVYHQEHHRGIGMTPQAAWEQSITKADRYLPPSSLILDSAFSSSCKRKLTHKGIEHDTLFYNSPELGVLREQFGSEIDVEIRTHDDELGSILVVFPDGKTLIRVAAVAIEYAQGMTRWQHDVCKRYRQIMMRDEQRDVLLLEARNRIRTLIEQDMKLTNRRSRTRQQRFLDKADARQSPESCVNGTKDSDQGQVNQTSLPTNDEPEKLAASSASESRGDTPSTVLNAWPDQVPELPSRRRQAQAVAV